MLMVLFKDGKIQIMIQMTKCLFLFSVLFIFSTCKVPLKMSKMHIINPFGKAIYFEKINSQQRKKLLAEEVKAFFRNDGILISRPVHLLKNGDYLLEYTIKDYALIFHTLNDLNLFSHNQECFPVDLFFEGEKLYYMFMIANNKTIEFMNTNPLYIDKYPSKTDYTLYIEQMKQMGVVAIMDYRLYKLKNQGYLRVNERAKGVYDASWFPDLESFEYFYENNYTI